MQKSLKWYQNRVKKLRSKPQPVQRSKEWFSARNTRVTASEVSACLPLIEEICKPYIELYNINKFPRFNENKTLSPYDTKEDYIVNKCRTFYGENLFKDSIYTLWGKKYEEIATRLYRIEYNTDVIEFGLLPHPRLNWIGASPDGITPNGIMLEIKCPKSRKINEGIPPIYYYTQMQTQMEVGDLDECDFLECEILELNNEEEFISQQCVNNQAKGILLNKIDQVDNSETKYIYPPDSLNTEIDFIEWSNNVINDNPDVKIEKLYYFVNKWFVVRIKRDKEWFSIIKPYLKTTIDIVRKLQADPILFKEYRDSIHKIKNKKYIETYEKTQCLIHYENDEKFIIHNNSSDYDIEYENKIEIDICLISE